MSTVVTRILALSMVVFVGVSWAADPARAFTSTLHESLSSFTKKSNPKKKSARKAKKKKSVADNKLRKYKPSKTKKYSKTKKRQRYAKTNKRPRKKAKKQVAKAKPVRVARRSHSVSQLKAIVRKYANAHNVPVKLANAVATIESNYRPHVTGPKGSVGLMQIKYATARGLGYRGSRQELYNPETNVKYAMKYLAGAYRKAKGDVCGTVLKYNAGHYAKRMNPISARYCKRAIKMIGSKRISLNQTPAKKPVPTILTAEARADEPATAARKETAKLKLTSAKKELPAFTRKSRTAQLILPQPSKVPPVLRAPGDKFIAPVEPKQWAIWQPAKVPPVMHPPAQMAMAALNVETVEDLKYIQDKIVATAKAHSKAPEILQRPVRPHDWAMMGDPPGKSDLAERRAARRLIRAQQVKNCKEQEDQDTEKGFWQQVASLFYQEKQPMSVWQAGTDTPASATKMARCG